METGKVLGPNQQGELRVKATFQCKGYFNQDSSEMFDSEGFLKTGDLGYYNEENCFFITNRIKESFKYQGNHIIPSDIENVLHSHPSIAKAVVLGLPHETDGNHPIAVIVPNEKGATVREEQIVKYVEERVEDKCRLRGGVKIVSEIPFTVTDKVNRFKLRQMVLNKEI
ncbi:hypothetical protein RI129_011445 [Pyrocoelia pectoralis]|uniref:AMP-binding enzyme C-terminal domain-containing protein n=1 Tax=Pyrocoelia pectoralis TaxID=417401 RepID=A0AAN7VB60_9COLE